VQIRLRCFFKLLIILGTLCYVGHVAGSTWSQSNAPIAGWRWTKVSFTGPHASAGIQDGQIYYSSDYGQTWTVSNAPSTIWINAGASIDGQKQVASGYQKNIHYSSNYGQTWTATGSTGPWHGAAMSSTGQYAVVPYRTGRIWIGPTMVRIGQSVIWQASSEVAILRWLWTAQRRW
jgi:photosystem II stability/assembly factor-like uncharacterized protein